MRVVWLAPFVSLGLLGAVSAQNPNFVFNVSDGEGATGSPVQVQVSIDVTGPAGLRAFVVPVCHDPAFASLLTVEIGASIESIEPVVFASIQQQMGPAYGFSVSVITDHPPGTPNALPVGGGYQVAVATYMLLAPGTSPLNLCAGTLPAPGGFYDPWVLDELGSESTPQTFGGSLTATPSSPLFVRGDANGDSHVDLGDAIFVLTYLFLSGPASCLVALDANDSGSVNVADATTLLGYLFTSGTVPPAPFPNCGLAPGSALTCSAQPICP
ncbi:MAG: dockerin type I repeat-containing protein [Planctomycetota bacterium]